VSGFHQLVCFFAIAKSFGYALQIFLSLPAGGGPQAPPSLLEGKRC
jgi:hypothetical protein